ncbi:LOW QUALITY PROTEIN: hypothetical protein Ct61P_11512 [Colletotrichum tofieldiae]|nr:LOW QUALITY PROTEIN: hypothetical protein Ct61P_11512 [Colletotrichum tofieldiae]
MSELSGGNGTKTHFTIDTKRDKTAEEGYIPIRSGVNQTTFMTKTSEDCGAVCRVVAAFEAAGTNSWYCRCNATVGHVGNASRPEHEVSESLRAMAATSIALQGSEVSSLDDDLPPVPGISG